MKKIILLFSLLLFLNGCKQKESKWEFVGTKQCVLTKLKENAALKFHNGEQSQDQYSIYLDLYRKNDKDGWIYGLQNDEGKIYTEKYQIVTQNEYNLRIFHFRYDGVVYDIVDYKK